MRGLKSPLSLGQFTPVIGTMLLDNRDRYGDLNAFAERQGGPYHHWSWQQMVTDILRFASLALPEDVLREDTSDNRVAFISANCYQRLVAEMAVMGTGMVAVPVFAGYAPDMMSDLLGFADVGMLVTDNLEKMALLRAGCLPAHIVAINTGGTTSDPELLEKLAGLGVASITFMNDFLAREASKDSAGLEQRMRAVVPDRDDHVYIRYQ